MLGVACGELLKGSFFAFGKRGESAHILGCDAVAEAVNLVVVRELVASTDEVAWRLQSWVAKLD